MQLLKSITIHSEYESAIMWHSQEKSKLESEYKSDSNKVVIDLEQRIDEYFENLIEKKEHSLTNALLDLYN